jgi:hypothetical protein
MLRLRGGPVPESLKTGHPRRRAMKEWYVVGRAVDGTQLAYVVEGETSEQAKENFAVEYPELTFVNIF